MSKISSIVLYILAAITVVLAGLFFFGPKDTILGHDDVPVFYDKNLAWAGILVALTIVLTIIFAIEFLITNPKALKGAAISLASAAVLVGVAYALASGGPVFGFEEGEVSATTSKWVDVGLIVAYILGGLAIVGMVLSEIYRALK